MSNSSDRINKNTLWASVFVEELFQSGVTTACISPGSRSTPLTLALANNPGIQVYTHIDERCGGFFALGHAKTTGVPVVLVSTSGTAAANFFPAIIEASYGRAPLIFLTADRPPELRDTGASQTIDQIKLFGGNVRWFFEVGTPEMQDVNLRHLRSLAARAVFEATRPPRGAVHLNFPFRAPLEPVAVAGGEIPPELEKDLYPGITGLKDRAFSKAAFSQSPAPPMEDLKRIAALVGGASRGLIVCGPMFRPPDISGDGSGDWADAVTTLARHSNYPILAEPPSQVRCGPHDKSQVIAHGEAILRSAAFRKKLAPEIIFRFGASPTSKHLEVLLEEHPGCPVVMVDEAGSWLESTHNPTDVIWAQPEEFCRALAEKLSAENTAGDGKWLGAFQEADRIAATAISEQFDEGATGGLGSDWFEGRVFSELTEILSPGALVYTSSSMPVRDLDAFTPIDDKLIHFLVNRGANGIDGLISSASGSALALKKAGKGPVVLVTGDLAFYHDSNGLIAAQQYELDLTVILINNKGGGIFEMLPISEFGEPYLTHFATPHNINFEALCSAYGVPVFRPGNWQDFRSSVGNSLSNPGTQVIEIFTDRINNKKQHQQVWKAVADRLALTFPSDRDLY